MSDFRDLSRLPGDQSYWDELEARIMADLGPRVREAPDRRALLWAPLAARAWGLGGLAIAAGIAAVLLMPARSPERVKSPAGLLRLPENDPTLVAFVSAPAPPAIGSLVIRGSTGGGDR